MAGINHQFTSAKSDGGDATLVRPSDWNAAHLIDGVAFGAGTSFPGSPTADDLFYRTDRNILYFYDGTRWLSETLYVMLLAQPHIGLPPYSATAGVGRQPAPYYDTYDLWLVEYEVMFRVLTTNNSTNYWNALLRKVTPALAATTIATLTSQNDTVNNFVYHKTAIGALLGNPSTYSVLDLSCTLTLSPGNLQDVSAQLTYRLVG